MLKMLKMSENEIAECGESFGDISIDALADHDYSYVLFSDFDTTIDSFTLIDSYSSSLVQPGFLLLFPDCLLFNVGLTSYRRLGKSTSLTSLQHSPIPALLL